MDVSTKGLISDVMVLIMLGCITVCVLAGTAYVLKLVWDWWQG